MEVERDEMAKSAFTAALISVYPFGAPEDLTKLSNIYGTGQDLLCLLHGLMQDVNAKHVLEESTNRVLLTQDIEPAGRTVRFTSKSGRYGTGGEIVDVESGETTHDFNEGESAITPTRNLFIVPENSNFGFFLAERYGGRGSYTAIRILMQKAFKQHFGNSKLNLRVEGLLNGKAWNEYVERANMKKLTVNQYRSHPNVARGVDVSSVGKVSTIMKPRRGLGKFDPAIKEGLISGKIQPDALLGIPHFAAKDVDVSLELDDGNQQRRLLLGSEEPANLLYMITGAEQGRPDNALVYGAMC